MATYRRGKNWWLSYSISKDLADQFGVPRKVRESAETTDEREAKRQLAKRRRDIEDGTWRPSGSASASSSVAAYAAQWTARRQRLGIREAGRDPERLGPLLRAGLGPMRMAEVKRPHVKRAVDVVRESTGRLGKAKGKRYSPTTIYRGYAVLRAMFAEAERDEVIVKNPCSLSQRDNTLPKRSAGADEAWRSGAIFSRPEIRMLISDDRIPPLRRMTYGLTFFCGLRLGEALARTWGDYDAAEKPLGRLRVHSQHEGRKLKTDVPRQAPVHAQLAAMLEQWRADYGARYGEKPDPAALILRGSSGAPVASGSVLGQLRRDLELLGLRMRRFHDLRRSLVTVARECGARAELLVYVTHGRPPGIMELYTSPPWSALCEQISCIRLD